MPSASPKPCLYPLCDQLVSGGYCITHAKALDQGYARSGRDIYGTPRWRGLRRQVLKDQPFCQHPGCLNLSTDADHIIPLRQGGAAWDRSNLQGLCAKHHGEKTIREVIHTKGVANG